MFFLIGSWKDFDKDSTIRMAYSLLQPNIAPKLLNVLIIKCINYCLMYDTLSFLLLFFVRWRLLILIHVVLLSEQGISQNTTLICVSYFRFILITGTCLCLELHETLLIDLIKVVSMQIIMLHEDLMQIWLEKKW